MQVNHRMPARAAKPSRFSAVFSLGMRVLIAVTLTFLGSRQGRAQCTLMGPPPSNAGTEFLLCFERNSDIARFDQSIEYCEIDIATLDAPLTTITITSRRYPALNHVVTLGPRDTVTWRISDIWPDLWINSADTIDDRVVKVTATSPIICYGQNRKEATADGFLALPVSSCGTEYRIMSYGNSDFSNAGGSMMPSQFAVAAFLPNTTVTITPAAPTATGHPAGAPFSVTLDAGQCIQVQTDGTIVGQDLTGSIVSATEPVAVFGSNARTEIPTSFVHFLSGISGTSRDMLLEQLPPIGVWGKNFVLAPLQIDATSKIRAEGDLMRALALKDNTVITVNGNPWITLNANGYADSLFHNPLVVSSTAPILLGEYAHTSSTGGTDNGDPFLAIVPPLDESFNDYTFFASNDPVYTVQKVIVATDADAMSSIRFDNITLPASFFTSLPVSVGGKTYAILELSVAPGAHRLYTNQSTNAFTILSYGLGSVTSYGYTAGALMKPLRSLFIHAQPTIASRKNRIVGDPIQLHNILNEQVYLDEADFIPDDPSDARFDIHVAEQLDPISGFLEIGQSSALHLMCNAQLARPVSGRIKIYSHTFNWHDLEPAEQPWTFYPNVNPNGSQAAVSGDGQQTSPTMSSQLNFRNYPNPFGLATTISFSVPETADVSLTLVDELGRVVRNIATGEFTAGAYNIRLDRHDLPNGFYNCELRSQKLGILEKIAIVATE